VSNADDKFTIAEFAKRYKVSDETLEAICESGAVSPDDTVTREDFKQMIEGVSPRVSASEPEKPEPKEEPVPEKKNKKKVPFSRLAAAAGLNRPRVAALKVCTGWEDETKLTEEEFDAAVKKNLKNKE